MPLRLRRVYDEMTNGDSDRDNSWRAVDGHKNEIDMLYHDVEDGVIEERRVSTFFYVEYTHVEWEENSSIQGDDGS